MPRVVGALFASLLAAALAVACAPKLNVPNPGPWEPPGQTKCSVGKSQDRPLIVEWPSPDRAALETQMTHGVVVVHYEGCEMRVLRHCHAPGSYGYQGVTRKRDRETIRNEDELYAKIPTSAVKLSATLASAGELNVDMSIVGSFESDREEYTLADLSGDCAGATHVVTEVTAGAFEFYAGASTEASGSVDVVGAGAGAKTKSQHQALTQDGTFAACDAAKRGDKQPPDGCGALLRIEVTRLAKAGGGATNAATPSPPVRTGPPIEVGTMAARAAAIKKAIDQYTPTCVAAQEKINRSVVIKMCGTRQDRMDLDAWGELRTANVDGYQFRLGCQARVRCDGAQTWLSYPALVYRGQIAPAFSPSDTKEARRYDAELVTLMDDAKGYFGLGARICSKASVLPRQACAGVADGQTAQAPSAPFAVIGETSNAVLVYDCQVTCTCKADDPVCNSAPTLRGAVDDAPIASRDVLAKLAQSGLRAVPMTEALPASPFVAAPKH